MFKQRQHKRFKYKPRYSKSDEAFASSVDASKSNEHVSKWQSIPGTTSRKRYGRFSVPILILILVLLLICMYLLEIKFMSN